jgi:hypothetical protein
MKTKRSHFKRTAVSTAVKNPASEFAFSELHRDDHAESDITTKPLDLLPQFLAQPFSATMAS